MRLLRVLALACPLAASAQALDLYGFNARAASMAGVEEAARDDFTAAYVNPALLGRGSFGLGFQWAKPTTHFEQTAIPDKAEPLAARTPPDYAGVSMGMAWAPRGKLDGKLTLGAGVYLPVRHAFRSRLIDDRTPSFFRYDNAPERFQVAAGFSARPLPWLSLGAGAQFVNDYQGDAHFTAQLDTGVDGRITYRELGSDVYGVVAPLFGAAVGPFAGARFYASFRGQVHTTYRLPIDVDLGGFGTLHVDVAGTSNWSPQTVTAGGSVELLEGRLL